MPKPKRKRNAFGFGLFGRGGKFSTSRTYRTGARPASTRYKGYAIQPRGDGYAVPSLDRDSVFDDKQEAKRFIDATTKRNPMKHARKTRVVFRRKGSKIVRKSLGNALGVHKAKRRNPELSIPKNKFINAKVRMKGGKLQVMVDQSLLGHASAGGSVSLNPKRKTVKRRKNLFGFGRKKKSSGYQAGDSVKISRGGERFWVTVTSVKGSRITGRVDNHLTLKHPFKFGSRISFGKASVIEHQK